MRQLTVVVAHKVHRLDLFLRRDLMRDRGAWSVKGLTFAAAVSCSFDPLRTPSVARRVSDERQGLEAWHICSSNCDRVGFKSHSGKMCFSTLVSNHERRIMSGTRMLDICHPGGYDTVPSAAHKSAQLCNTYTAKCVHYVMMLSDDCTKLSARHSSAPQRYLVSVEQHESLQAKYYTGPVRLQTIDRVSFQDQRVQKWTPLKKLHLSHSGYSSRRETWHKKFQQRGGGGRVVIVIPRSSRYSYRTQEYML